MSNITIRVKLTRENSVIRPLLLEEYLRGVVPSEMPAGSAGAEALKAQAVAARTYALQKIMTRSGQSFDVDDTTSYQAFYSKKIHTNGDKAVRDTAGQVLVHGGKILDTCVYCASNGGRTRSSQEVWGGARAYLPAKDDAYDRAAGHARNGHGVGMSQHGAMQMDKAGLGYKVILAYYYPGAQVVDAGNVYKAPAASPGAPEGSAVPPFAGVRTFSRAKDGNTKLTPNFKVNEFAIDRCTGDAVKICGETVGALQAIRNHYGKAVDISSGYRSTSGTSQHCHGRAADFRISGVDPCAIVRWIEANLNPPGLGLYDYNPKTEGKTGFVHIDYRTGAKARWWQTKKDDSDYTSTGGVDLTVAYLDKRGK